MYTQKHGSNTANPSAWGRVAATRSMYDVYNNVWGICSAEPLVASSRTPHSLKKPVCRQSSASSAPSAKEFSRFDSSADIPS